MATAAQTPARAARPTRPEVKASMYSWEGIDRAGKKLAIRLFRVRNLGNAASFAALKRQ